MAVAAQLNLPLVLGGLKLTSNVSINVEITGDQVGLGNLGGELVSSEGPLGLATLEVLANLGLGLARVLSLAILPFSAVFPGEGSALS